MTLANTVHNTTQPSASHELSTRDILGVSVSTLDADETITLLDSLVAERRTTVVAFLNANLSNLAANDTELLQTLQRALVLNDGIGVDIASLVLHSEKFKDNLNGTDFVPRYFLESKQKLRVYLLGAKAEVNAEALARFRRMAPQHDFVGGRNGYFNAEERPEVLAEIKKLQLDVVLIAFGNPLQELFAGRHIHEMGCTLVFCIGGLFDFISQRAKRAPLWVQKLRSEWLHRLYQDPKRLWKRYFFGNPKFLLRVALAKVRSGVGRGSVTDAPKPETNKQNNR